VNPQVFEPRSAAELYLLAESRPPVGTPAPSDGVCAACGRPIERGELVVPVSDVANPGSFTKWAYMARPGSPWACGHCAATRGAEYQSGSSKAKSFACAAGVYPLHRGVDLARFVLNPPDPPYAAVFSTRQQQSMVFRTPLNWSREVIVLRFDDELVDIRVARVRDAATAWREIDALCAEKYGDAPAIKLGKSGIGVLSMTLVAPEVGKLQAPVIERMHAMGRADLLDAIVGLTPGETWALACVVQLPADDPLVWRSFDPESATKPKPGKKPKTANSGGEGRA